MSYDLLGFKWGSSAAGSPSGVVTWSGDVASSLTHSSSYSDANFDNALQAAFDRWEGVASIDFERVASGGDISIGIADHSGAIAGQAGYSPIARAGFDGVTNTSLTFDISSRTWSPGSAGPGESNFFAVALHEVGHLMGLAHPAPDDSSEIMNRIISVDDLGDGDISGAQHIYGRDSGDVAPPSGGGGGAGFTGDGGGGGGGILIGLLAALLGIFLGGGAAAAALVAGRLQDDDDDAPADDHADAPGHDQAPEHGHDHSYVYGEMNYHNVYLPPIAIADESSSPCGCFVPCDCALEDAALDDFLL